MISTVNNIQPSDISVHPVSGEIYCVANSSILSIDLVNNIEEVFSFENEIPIALDVFEVFAYVLLSSGVLKQVNIHRTSEGIFNYFVCGTNDLY